MIQAKVAEILESDQFLQEFKVSGWVRSFRSNRFVALNDGSTINNIQCVIDFEKFNALGVTQYGQMTAGSYMYIGPQGIVHGTTITILNAFRKIGKNPKGKVFLTSGLGPTKLIFPMSTFINCGSSSSLYFLK